MRIRAFYVQQRFFKTYNFAKLLSNLFLHLLLLRTLVSTALKTTSSVPLRLELRQLHRICSVQHRRFILVSQKTASLFRTSKIHVRAFSISSLTLRCHLDHENRFVCLLHLLVAAKPLISAHVHIINVDHIFFVISY